MFKARARRRQNHAMHSNIISLYFDLKGPSPVIDTACSSSMVEIDIALTDLRLGKSS
jgi:acyl transferase domain-containing protein